MKKPAPGAELPKSPASFDSWRIFRIMAEFVDGFETMMTLGPAVAVFGSTTKPIHEIPYRKLATQISEKLVKKGFGIITGGGPGLMECVNQATQKVGGKSCGLCINLPSEEKPNPFIDPKYHLSFRYFFVRKVMFVRYAKGFVVLPGGFGTLNELFEALTLIQTERSKFFPIYLAGTDYWKDLISWIKNTAVAGGYIKPEHFDLIRISDDPDEIANGIEKHWEKTESLENF